MKSSFGKLSAGRLWSPSRSRTVLLYWLCVSRRSDQRLAAVPVVRALGSSASRELLVRKSDQIVDPARSKRPPFAARRKALAAGVRDAIGGLQKQQRFFRIRAVNESTESEAEGGDLLGFRVVLGNCRRVAAATPLSLMAQVALRVVHQRIELFGEEGFVVGDRSLTRQSLSDKQSRQQTARQASSPWRCANSSSTL